MIDKSVEQRDVTRNVQYVGTHVASGIKASNMLRHSQISCDAFQCPVMLKALARPQ